MSRISVKTWYLECCHIKLNTQTCESLVLWLHGGWHHQCCGLEEVLELAVDTLLTNWCAEILFEDQPEKNNLKIAVKYWTHKISFWEEKYIFFVLVYYQAKSINPQIQPMRFINFLQALCVLNSVINYFLLKKTYTYFFKSVILIYIHPMVPKLVIGVWKVNAL